MPAFTKWPRLLVVGEHVTREQANEILVRTDNWSPATNDRAWEQTIDDLAAEFGRPIPPKPASTPGIYLAYCEAMRSWEESLGILDLEYMDNVRIASAWLGGPYGWCDWDGRIGCSTYNIGKWPDEESCTADWQAVAAAFPYLNLHAQLVSDEGEGEVVAMWAVKDGKAALVEPVERLTEVSELDLSACLDAIRGPWSGRERGVSLRRLREALEQVKAAGSEAR